MSGQSGDMPLRKARTKREKNKTYQDSRMKFRASMKPNQSDPHSEDEDKIKEKKMKIENDNPEEGAMGHSSSDVAMGGEDVKPTSAEQLQESQAGGSNGKKAEPTPSTIPVDEESGSTSSEGNLNIKRVKKNDEMKKEEKKKEEKKNDEKKKEEKKKEAKEDDEDSDDDFFWDAKPNPNDPPKKGTEEKVDKSGKNADANKPMLIDSESDSTSYETDDFDEGVCPNWFQRKLSSPFPRSIPEEGVDDESGDDDDDDDDEDNDDKEKDGDDSSGGKKDGDGGGAEGGDKKSDDESKDGGGSGDDKQGGSDGGDKGDDGSGDDGKDGGSNDDKKKDEEAADDEEKEDETEPDGDKKHGQGSGDDNENDPDGPADSAMKEDEPGDPGADTDGQKDGDGQDFNIEGAKDPYAFDESEDEDLEYDDDYQSDCQPHEFLSQEMLDDFRFYSDGEDDFFQEEVEEMRGAG